ncbi:unnamed protein product [Triticum turgidum subsp. durum]|uniref:Uncharacterized protein n=1 Tax=Triticum turgidum subsp. durum TaxID=4567 RepID=A0A9R0QGM8_TRITD|nr:unnamed protein product [Triticum turgidum subsp. durum]
MAHMRVVHRDEEGHKVAEKLPVPETRRPDTARHVERKLEEQGLHRLERHPANAPRGVGSELDPAPAAIDRNDPNYDEEEGGEQDEVAKEVVVGEVEVAKVAQARAGVARVEVAPPLLQDHDHQQ